jgi:Protein of unknown function (DUF2884)
MLSPLVILLLGVLAAPVLGADFDAACRVRSNYDLTVSAGAVLFERATAPAQSVEMSRGNLKANGKPVALGVKDRDRIAAFEATLRSLIPQVKALAQRAVEMSVAAIREEAASISPKMAADPQLNQRLKAHAKDLKMRIANSTTSKDWRGATLNRYTAEVLSDVLPLVGGDLARQAVEAALRGDLAAASALTNRAAGLRASLEARIRNRLEVLRPEADKLCPALRRLDTLESAVDTALPGGGRLDLLEVGR